MNVSRSKLAMRRESSVLISNKTTLSTRHVPCHGNGSTSVKSHMTPRFSKFIEFPTTIYFVKENLSTYAASLLPMITPYASFPFLPLFHNASQIKSIFRPIYFWDSAGEISVGAIRRFLLLGSSIGVESEGVSESLF